MILGGGAQPGQRLSAAEFIREAKDYSDAAALVYLDMVNKFY